MALGAGLTALSALALFVCYRQGWILYYGDAEAHLDIARRILDSRTPGYDQVGTVWLPLPHWLMLPLVVRGWLWFNGLAGAIPSAIAFVAGGLFFYGAVRRALESPAAGFAAVAIYALNPNTLYLQATPMTESESFLWLAALFYFMMRFRDTQGWGSVAGAGIAACAGTLTRYEFWLMLPFASLWFVYAARRRRLAAGILFGAIAAPGPLFWFFHNWWLSGDWLGFYRGPWSARAIQGSADYPGRGDWGLAWLYFRTAAELCAGPCLPLIAVAGVAAALLRRAFWPLFVLAIPGALYVWSMYNGTVPIFMPVLKPFSYYNTRYGMAVLPLLAFAAAAVVAALPYRTRWMIALLALAAAAIPWIAHPAPGYWITWEESRVNSVARRAWTRETADFLRGVYRPGAGILSSFGMQGIYREAEIPLEETFTGDNGIPFDAAVRRPELFLHEEWVVALAGSDAEKAVERAAQHGIHYSLVKTVIVKDAPVIEIYRR